MAATVLNVFADSTPSMSLDVVARLSRYCRTGSSWKNCMAPAQDISTYLIPDFILPRLLPTAASYDERCQEIVDYIQGLNRQRTKTDPVDAAEYNATENLRIERRTLSRSRDPELARKRKAQDEYTCRACELRLCVNNHHILDCHHIRPLSKDELARETTLEDLISLCPNCHRVAHTRLNPLSVEEIREAIENS